MNYLMRADNINYCPKNVFKQAIKKAICQARISQEFLLTM
jgi:hypothetical protein